MGRAAAGHNALQVTVSRARRDLGPLADRLRTEAGGYRLHVEPDELDAERFTRGYEAAARCSPPAARTRRRRRSRDALALWRGPVLGELGYEAFAQAEVRRLEELRVLALEERVEADLARGEHAPLAGELEALVAEHPLRERLRGQQMLALYRLGRQADALATYRDFRTRLDDELGLRARAGAARARAGDPHPRAARPRRAAARPADADRRPRGGPAPHRRRCSHGRTSACSR